VAYDETKDKLIKTLTPVPAEEGEFALSLRQYGDGPVKLHIDRVKTNKSGKPYAMRPGRLTRTECMDLGKALMAESANSANWPS
jgi:hypothetical protein